MRIKFSCVVRAIARRSVKVSILVSSDGTALTLSLGIRVRDTDAVASFPSIASGLSYVSLQCSRPAARQRRDINAAVDRARPRPCELVRAEIHWFEKYLSASATGADSEFMSSKLPLPLKVPPDVWRWVRAEAASRRMPVGNYVLELLRRGILDETIEQTVAQTRSALTQPRALRELLRHVLVLRYVQEAMLDSERWSALFPEAVARADAEVARILAATENPTCS